MSRRPSSTELPPRIILTAEGHRLTTDVAMGRRTLGGSGVAQLCIYLVDSAYEQHGVTVDEIRTVVRDRLVALDASNPLPDHELFTAHTGLVHLAANVDGCIRHALDLGLIMPTVGPRLTGSHGNVDLPTLSQ